MATYFGFPPVMSGEFYFVSYNSQDSARVGGIAREMNARGIPLWYDEGLLVGEAWEKQIARQIEQCRAVIMFVTKKLMARENPYVKIEYNMAMGFKKKIYVIFLDNVTFDDVTIDLKGWWLRLNDLHGVPVSDISRAADIVDIMDRHIHFIKNAPEPEFEPEPELEPVSENGSVALSQPSFISKYGKALLISIAAVLLIAVGVVVVPRIIGDIGIDNTGYIDDTGYDSASNYSYTIKNGEVIITGLKNKNLTELSIPKVIAEKSVTRIGNNAFSNCISLTSVKIPDSVVSIGTNAFRGSNLLTSVAIPNGVTLIGYGTFYGCTSLMSITIPNSVTYIGYNAFSKCISLT